MAKLTDIAIYFEHGDDSSETIAMRQTFAGTNVPVTEIFILMMERHVLDGRGHLNIFLRRNGSRHRVYEPLPARMGSISEYHIGHFDWKTFLSSDSKERGDIVVNILESSLVDICERCKADPRPYKVAAEKTRATEYRHVREIKSLSRSTRDRKFRFTVRRTLKVGSGERWDIDLIGRKQEIIFSRCIVSSIMSVSARYAFRDITLENDVFSILDFLKRPVFSVALSGDVALFFDEERYSEKVEHE